MEEILFGMDKKGGLLGMSGVSNDLRDVQQAADEGNKRALLAVDAYCNALLKYIGAFYVELGGLDYLVFTGGIGENSSVVRAKVCSSLAHLGIAFDVGKNEHGKGRFCISTEDSGVKVYVIPANEELGIARSVFRELSQSE